MAGGGRGRLWAGWPQICPALHVIASIHRLLHVAPREGEALQGARLCS